MTKLIAVFRSRTQAADCCFRLKRAGVNARLINTPKQANVGCGLSVELPERCGDRCKKIIARANFSAFYGYLTLKA